MPKITPPRCTHHINRHAAENICHAIDYAKNINLPLNQYVVLNLDEEGSGLEGTEIFRRVRHKFRDWLNRQLKKRQIDPTPPAYVYSHEKPVKWSHLFGQVCGSAKMHLVCVHAAFRVSLCLKYAASGVRLSRAV